MKANRSVASAVVVPVLIYPDVAAAVQWLGAAFGFVERLRIADHRAQMTFGDGAIIVAEPTQGRAVPKRGENAHAVMVRVPDADAHCARARAHGAVIVSEPEDFPYGERQYSARDLAGHSWVFSETLDDVDPASWGGEIR